MSKIVNRLSCKSQNMQTNPFVQYISIKTIKITLKLLFYSKTKHEVETET